MIKVIIGIDRSPGQDADAHRLFQYLKQQQRIVDKIHKIEEAGYHICSEFVDPLSNDRSYFVRFDSDEEAVMFKLTHL